MISTRGTGGKSATVVVGAGVGAGVGVGGGVGGGVVRANVVGGDADDEAEDVHSVASGSLERSVVVESVSTSAPTPACPADSDSEPHAASVKVATTAVAHNLVMATFTQCLFLVLGRLSRGRTLV
jgi:hypothetical protein